jgi:hypothetical protein
LDFTQQVFTLASSDNPVQREANMPARIDTAFFRARDEVGLSRDVIP